MQISMRAQDESTDPKLRELIYGQATVIRPREQDAAWVWDVLIRIQDRAEARLGVPVESGEVYPLLVMDNVGRNASPFLVASMCARGCAASAAAAIEADAPPEIFGPAQSGSSRDPFT
jgi:hypothetical protein